MLYLVERRAVENLFPGLDASSVTLVKVPCDGPGETLAYVRLHPDAPSSIIWLDGDWKQFPLQRGLMQDGSAPSPIVTTPTKERPMPCRRSTL